MNVVDISSRDNPLVKELQRLAQDNQAYRKQRRVWLEGDHLCRAFLQRGGRPQLAVFTEDSWPALRGTYGAAAARNVVLKPALMRAISGLESPAPLAFVAEWQPAAGLQAGLATVVLDRLQDAGNVGAILRSAGAFGFGQVAALTGTAALWSPKVLRAGMGAHFGLRLVEGLAPADLPALQLPLLVTSSHGGQYLHQGGLPFPCAWVLGHEGQGVQPELEQMAALKVRIAQPGGEESLNVAVAAGICLHASAAGALG
ncbi:MAG: RNA methyltransferase [Comamonas sp.]